MAIFLAALTVVSTAIGGLLALKSKDRFHLVLGLSATKVYSEHPGCWITIVRQGEDA